MAAGQARNHGSWSRNQERRGALFSLPPVTAASRGVQGGALSWREMKTVSIAATTLQILATGLLGLMAGFFFAVSAGLLPAMPGVHLGAPRAIQRVVNDLPLAMIYFGAVLVPLLAALALWLAGEAQHAQVWLVIAVVYLIGVFLLTGEFSVPIGDALAQWESRAISASWMREPGQADRANLLRCVTACVSFAAALAALASRPRPTRPG